MQVDEGDVHYSRIAGFPMYTPDSVISLVTTAPAPITTPSQMDTGRSVALLPMETLFPTKVDFHFVRSPWAGPPSEKTSLMKTTPCPMKQSLPMVTNSQMNEWL